MLTLRDKVKHYSPLAGGLSVVLRMHHAKKTNDNLKLCDLLKLIPIRSHLRFGNMPRAKINDSRAHCLRLSDLFHLYLFMCAANTHK